MGSSSNYRRLEEPMLEILITLLLVYLRLL